MSALQTAFRRLPLRRKLIAVTVGVSTIALLLSATMMISQGLRDKKASLTQTLTLTARLISDDSAQALEKGDHDAASGSLLPLIENKAVRLGCLYGSDGQIFAEYAVSDSTCANGFIAAMRTAAATGTKTFLDDMKDLFGAVSSAHLAVAYPVKEDGRLLGVLYLQSNLSEWQAFVRTQLYAAGVAIVVSALLAVALTTWLQNMIADPALKLAQVAKELTATHNYDLRVVKETEDEFGMLADAFNEILGVIRRRERSIATSETAITTARAAAEKANETASDSQTIAKAMLSVVEQGVLVVDKDLRVSMVNDRVRYMFRNLGSEVKVGANFAELLKTRQRQAGQSEEEIEAYLQKLAEPFREEYVTPDGNVVAVRHVPLPGRGFLRTYTEIAGIDTPQADRRTA